MSRPPSAVDPSSGKSTESMEGVNGETEKAFGGDGDTPAPLELGVSVTEMQNESSSKVAVSQEVGTGGAAGAAGARISYAGAVDGSSESSSSQPIFEVKNGVAEIEIPVEIFEDAEPLWKCFMVGYFMNDAPHIGSIHSTVNRIWASQGKTSKIDGQFIGKKTILFRVEDEATRNRVMRRKFWHIADVPLVVYEWNPKTAQAPPDLSAMPLWVDLKNVPGYLYSKKGLSFLACTTGKFVKLHPNTEKCIRLDVARMLVEVDFQKPLPQKICFVERDGIEVTVEVSYPWLPPCCGNCTKWGHTDKDCQVVKTLVILQRQEGVNEGITTEGTDKELALEKRSGVVVSDLIGELEATAGSLVKKLGCEGSKSHQEPLLTDWSLPQGRRHHSPPKTVRIDGKTISPGRFQYLSERRGRTKTTGVRTKVGGGQ
ncbi:unnamed protein product [Brassica rapa subsp. trilocularis]